MFSTADRRLDTLAGAQHGVFTRRQAMSAGCTRSMIDRRLATGHWVRVDAAVYAIASHPVTWHYRCVAAALSVPSGLVSGRAAAHLHGFDGFRVGDIDVIAPPGSNERSHLPAWRR